MGTIRRTVAAVLRFLDTAAMAPVSGSGLYIQIRQKSPVIRKDDGYAVILAQPGADRLDIDVSGRGFLPVHMRIGLAKGEPAKIHYVYLLPSKSYPFTQKMAVICARSAARKLYAVRMADGGRYRLMQDIGPDSDAVKIWGIERFLQGQQLLFAEGGQYALATLTEAEDGTEYGYRLGEHVSRYFPKGKTKVYSVIAVSPDEDGCFRIAYDKVDREGERIRFLGEEAFFPEKKEKADTKIDAETEIREGQEIEIHVG